MRGVISWFSAAAVAFLVTAGAFLLLANLGRDQAQDQRISRPQSTQSGPTLKMELQGSQLEALEQAPGQRLAVQVSNNGSRPISGVNTTVKVASENTAISETRIYRADVAKLKADETKTVEVDVDLSFFEAPVGNAPDSSVEPPRTILEFRATTLRGASAVKTVILPP